MSYGSPLHALFDYSKLTSPPRSATYTTLIRMTYGINVVSDDDVLVALIGETLNRLVAEGPPGASPIDFFPLR